MSKKYQLAWMRFCASLVIFSMVFAMPATAFANDGDEPEPTPAEVVDEETDSEETATEEAVVGVEEAASPEAEEEPTADGDSTEVPETTEQVEPETEEGVAEIIQALADTNSILVNEEGEVISMASSEAEEILSNPDPYIVRGGVTHRFLKECDDFWPDTATSICTESNTPIQTAINFAELGETVFVEAGNYNESPSITKSLTLSGANAGIDPNTGVRGAEAIINGQISILADNVTIDGFTLTNPFGSYAVYSQDYNSLTITNNIITNVGGSDSDNTSNFGVLIQPSNSGSVNDISITNNLIQDIDGDNETVAGIGILDSDNTGVVTNLVIKDNVITNNNTSITAKGAYGILINHGVNSTGSIDAPQITGNTISNLEGLWAHAIGLEGDTPNALVLNNAIDNIVGQNGFGTAIRIEKNDGADSVTISGNSFTNTVLGILESGSTGPVNASGNWWGSADGATIANMILNLSGNDVDFGPWLKSGVDQSTATGFQADTSELVVDDLSPQSGLLGQIEEAVNWPGVETVYVMPGTYTEGQIEITGDVMIIGDQLDKPVIIPSGNINGNSAVNAWFLVDPGVSFSMSDFEINGNGLSVWQAIRNHGTTILDGIDFKNIVASASPYYGVAVASYGGTVAGGIGSDSHGAGGANSTLTVTDSTFTNIGRIGILIKGTDAIATITGNTYTGQGAGNWLDYAIEVGAGGSATITNNTISNNIGVAASDGSTSAGILVTTFYGAGSTATITGNTFANNTTGIAVGYNGADTSTVTAHQNTISGNGTGVSSTGPTVNATLNWWGCWQGPGNTGCDVTFGPVTTNPHLTVPPGQVDTDGDGIRDAIDNCPTVFDPTNDPDACASSTSPDDDDDETITTIVAGVTGGGGPIIPVTGLGTTLTLELTPAQLDEALEAFANNEFPLEADEDGNFTSACVLETVTFLQEVDYISMGDYLITVVGQCSYLVNGVKQTITMALAMINTLDNTLIIPGQEGTSDPADFDPDSFLASTGLEPGAILSTTVGMTDDDFYTEDQLAAFGETGEPISLDNFMIPISAEVNGNVIE